MQSKQEILILGACEAIRLLAKPDDDKAILLKKTFPYLTQEDVDHWVSFYRL